MAKQRKKCLRARAIRGAWAVARAAGIERGNKAGNGGLMSDRPDVRLAVVNAWEAGYRAAKHDARKGVGQ